MLSQKQGDDMCVATESVDFLVFVLMDNIFSLCHIKIINRAKCLTINL